MIYERWNIGACYTFSHILQVCIFCLSSLFSTFFLVSPQVDTPPPKKKSKVMLQCVGNQPSVSAASGIIWGGGLSRVRLYPTWWHLTIVFCNVTNTQTSMLHFFLVHILCLFIGKQLARTSSDTMIDRGRWFTQQSTMTSGEEGGK